ncbi:MAG TPA: hypothetical protein VFI96_02100 [Longimicrobiaceae bacterium]|nr:hypothetical protein [Longimicrobiaceae bacterium]
MIFRRRRRGFSRTQRLHHLLWSLLFLVTGATQQGFGLRPCIHDAAMRDMPAMAGMAGMHGGAMSHGGGHHGPSHAPEHTRCTCLGMCQAGGTATLPAPTLRAAVAGAVVGRVVAALPRHERLRAPTPYLIPFSQAPPRLG